MIGVGYQRTFRTYPTGKKYIRYWGVFGMLVCFQALSPCLSITIESDCYFGLRLRVIEPFIDFDLVLNLHYALFKNIINYRKVIFVTYALYVM